MTSPTPLSREELIELAALDVFGLLDEYEAALYTRSFHDAPAVVQDEVMELQAELASDRALLPEEDPDPKLRDRVLDTVSRAMEREAESLRPIASIGRPQASADIAVMTGTGRPAAALFWRAATFVLAAGLIVVLYFNTQLLSTGNEIVHLAMNKDTSEQLEKYVGPGLAEFAENPQCRPINFELDDANGISGATAVLYINDDTQEAFLMVVGLPQGDEKYTIQSVNDGDNGDGTSAIVKSFTSNMLAVGVRLESLSSSMLASASWTINDSAGRTLLRSV